MEGETAVNRIAYPFECQDTDCDVGVLYDPVELHLNFAVRNGVPHIVQEVPPTLFLNNQTQALFYDVLVNTSLPQRSVNEEGV